MKAKLRHCLEKRKWQIFLLFWIVNVLLSVVYKFYYYDTGQHLKFTWIPDLLFLLVMFLTIPPRRYKTAYIGIGLLFLFKAIGSFSIVSFYDTSLELYKDVVKSWVGYSYIFLLFIFLSDKINSNRKDFDLPRFIQKSFVLLAGSIALCVFIGLILKSYVFHTYTDITRFGISGVLYPFSYVSYFYILGISISYLLHKNKPEEKSYSVLLYVLSVAALFSGTKSTYLFLLLFYGVFILDKAFYRKKSFWMFVAASLGLVFVFYKKLLSAFIVLVDLYKKEDFWTFALSYRNLKVEERMFFIKENWTWYNYLFGGLNNTTHLTEMAFVDLFLNFGLLGFLIFLLLYYYYILRHLSWRCFNLTIAIGFLFILALGGNFFDRIYLAYWLVIYFLVQLKAYKYKSL